MAEIMLAVRVVISLGVVVLLLWGLSRWLHVRQGQPGQRTVPMQVVGRVGVGRNAGVAVLEVGERLLVVGVADKNITLLSELDAHEFPAAPEVDPHDTAAGASTAGTSTADTSTADTSTAGALAADRRGGPRPALRALPGLREMASPFTPGKDSPMTSPITDLDGYTPADALPAQLTARAAAVDITDIGAPQATAEQAPAGQPPVLLSRRARAARERARTEHPSRRPAGPGVPALGSGQASADSAIAPVAPRRSTAGSVLDPATWQQTARALKHLRKAQ